MKALALAFLLALLPLGAGAEGAPEGEHSAAEEAAHRKEFIYEWVNLLLLAGVLLWVGRKPVQEYLGARRNAIAKNIASSEQLLHEAEQKLAEWNAKAARLDADVNEILSATRKSAEAERAAILADAEATASRVRQSAAGVVERELRAARESLRAEAAELAVSLAAQLLREQVNADDRNRLVDEFIAKVEGGPGGAR